MAKTQIHNLQLVKQSVKIPKHKKAVATNPTAMETLEGSYKCDISRQVAVALWHQLEACEANIEQDTTKQTSHGG